MDREGHEEEIYFIIPAAGVGSRMASEIPKQYLQIAGETILTHTLKLFLGVQEISGGVVALSAEDQRALGVESDVLWRVDGGETRTDSVAAGLYFLKEHLSRAGKDLKKIWVAVHDAARPGLRSNELSLFLRSVLEDSPEGGAIMALPAQDTVKRVDKKGEIVETLDRDVIWLAQTPQMAPLLTLIEATERATAAGAKVTDEASLLEYNGLSPKVYRGYPHNFKITYPADLQLMSLYFSERR